MNSQKFAKDFLIFAKVAKFRQIWSHCSLTSRGKHSTMATLPFLLKARPFNYKNIFSDSLLLNSSSDEPHGPTFIK